MTTRRQTVLVLAPHTDDGELGCGATIAKRIQAGDDVHYAAFSICEESVPEGFPRNVLDKEVRDATLRLGIPAENLTVNRYPVRQFPAHRQEILDHLVEMSKELEPDLVFMPSSHDVHQDHQVIHQEGLRAFKHTSILGYEFMWNNYSFGSTFFSVVSEEHIESKIGAIAVYESQAERLYSFEGLIRGIATFRGLQIGTQYAEAFEVLRWIDR